MFFKFPKSDARFGWTRHIKNKMIYYHISPAQVMRIFRRPVRREEGIAENTHAAMIVHKKNSSAKGPKQEELWLMYQTKAKSGGKNTSKVTMISAWRYPGKTKPGDPIPVPEDISSELASLL